MSLINSSSKKQNQVSETRFLSKDLVYKTWRRIDLKTNRSEEEHKKNDLKKNISEEEQSRALKNRGRMKRRSGQLDDWMLGEPIWSIGWLNTGWMKKNEETRRRTRKIKWWNSSLKNSSSTWIFFHIRCRHLRIET